MEQICRVMHHVIRRVCNVVSADFRTISNRISSHYPAYIHVSLHAFERSLPLLELDIMVFLWYCVPYQRGVHMSTIEELYYGNITPAEQEFRRNSEYAHVLQLATRSEEKLIGTLTEAQKETFETFKDNTSKLSSLTEVTAFSLGFKLGLRLTAEAFICSNTDQDLIDE